MLCPNFRNKSVMDDFNSIVESLGGVALNSKDVSNRLEYRDSLTPEQKDAYYQAHFYWDKHKGNVDDIIADLEKLNSEAPAPTPIMQEFAADPIYFSKPRAKPKKPIEISKEKEARAVELEQTIKSLRARLNFQMSDDALLDRAKLELQIANYTAEKRNVIIEAIYAYARAIGIRVEPNNKVDTLLKNVKSAKSTVKNGVVIQSQLKKAMKQMDDLMLERSRRRLVSALRAKMKGVYDKMEEYARDPKALPWTVEASEQLLQYMSAFQYAEPYTVTGSVLVKADDEDTTPGRKVYIKAINERGNPNKWIAYDAESGYVLGRDATRAKTIAAANGQIAAIGEANLAATFAAAKESELIWFVDKKIAQDNDDLMQKIQQDIESREARGEGESMPTEYLEALKSITVKNIAEMENVEIARAIIEINEILTTGRTKNAENNRIRKEEMIRQAKIAEREINDVSGYRPGEKSRAEGLKPNTVIDSLISATTGMQMEAVITPQTMFQWITATYTKVGKRARSAFETNVLERIRTAYFKEQTDWAKVKEDLKRITDPIMENRKLSNMKFSVTAEFRKIKELTKSEDKEYRELLKKKPSERTEEEQKRYDELDDITEAMESVTQTHEYNLEEMMFVYANSRNSGNLAHLYGTGWTESGVSEVERLLPVEAKNVVEAMWEYYDVIQYPKINEVYRRLYNQDMPHVPYYFPIMNILTPNAEYSIAADLIARYGSKASVGRGFAISRVKSKAPFKKMEFFWTVFDNAQKVTHFVHSAEAIRDVTSFLGAKSEGDSGRSFIKDALEHRSKHYNAYAWVDDFVKRMAYGRSKTVDPNYLDKMADLGRFAFTVYVLGLNIKTVMKTFGNVIVASRYVKPAQLAWSAMNVYMPVPVKTHDVTYELPSGEKVTVKKGEVAPPWARAAELIALAKDKSDMMKFRSEAYDREVQEIRERLAKKDVFGRLIHSHGIKDKAREMIDNALSFSMMGITMADRINSTMVWYAKYREVLNSTKDEKIAIRLADEIVEKTFPGGGLLYYTKFQMGGGVKRVFSMFTSDLVKVYSAWYEVAADAKNQGLSKGTWEVAWMSFLCFFLPGTLMYLVNNGFDPEKMVDDPEGLLGTVFSQMYGGFPVINQILDLATAKAANASREARFAPVQRVFSTAVSIPGLASIFDIVEQFGDFDEDPADFLLKVARIGAIVSGVPINAPITMFKGISDISSGKSTNLKRALWSESQLKPASVESRVGRALAVGKGSKDYLRAILIYSQMNSDQSEKVIEEMIKYKKYLMDRAMNRGLQNKIKRVEKKVKLIEKYTK